jgi:hypothetical protein
LKQDEEVARKSEWTKVPEDEEVKTEAQAIAEKSVTNFIEKVE